MGHSSGELLALAAAGVFPTDRELERKLGRLGAIMRDLESSGELPEARLVAVAADRGRVEGLCRELGALEVAVAMDNCPHQVVVAVPLAEHPRVVARLRADRILHEELPFSRAYHTPGFGSVVGPIAEFLDGMSFDRPRTAIYSCASRARMPDAPEAIRRLAIAQWTRTVAFRETALAMHASGLRVFVDVGARGNLAGFVEDTLRGKPSFAMAANLPRRSGLTQLNHLVAALFAQGAMLKSDYLYARRGPSSIDWSAAHQKPRTLVELNIGFPEMRLSDAILEQLGSCSPSHVVAGECDPGRSSLDDRPRPAETVEHRFAAGGAARAAFAANGHAEAEPWASVADATTECDDAILSFQDTMQSFLQTQREVMAAYVSGSVREELAIDGTAHEAITAWHELGSRSHQVGSHSASEESAPNIDAGWRGSSTSACLAGEPGPWVGEVRRLEPGYEVETRLVLQTTGDPIAHHHTLGGRKISALDPSLLGLPVVPFAVMAEMAAQVAALVAGRELILTGIKQARAHKWVRYEEESVHLELRGRRVSSDVGDGVWVGIFNRGVNGHAEASRPVFEAVAVFGSERRPPPSAENWSLEDARASRFTARSVYEEQWLFHGPPFQAIARMGTLSARGIEGSLRVLPLEPLLKKGEAARFHTDVIVIDSFTQLLGAWGLDFLSEGDVVFPLGMDELEIFGPRPREGEEVECQITVLDMRRHRIRVEAQLVRPDGTTWMRIKGWEDWRFHWPGRYRDAFRQPRDYWMGEELMLADPAAGPVTSAKAVWLEPPADMARPIWRDVLEFTQLGTEERARHLARNCGEQQRTQRVWGWIAAKEAARRLWSANGVPPTYPADLAVVDTEPDGLRIKRVDQNDLRSLPSLSIAHADGVAVALAVLAPGALAGIAVEAIVECNQDFETTVLVPAERALLERWSGPTRAEWVARFRCARQAALRAYGKGLPGECAAHVVDVEERSGVIHVSCIAARSHLGVISSGGEPVRVVSSLKNNRAWAWTSAYGTTP
jgi:malonyl CoA-acyl carrier protein transacylase